MRDLSISVEALAANEAQRERIVKSGRQLIGIDETEFNNPMSVEQILTINDVESDNDEYLNLVLVVWPANGWMIEIRLTADNGLTSPNLLHFTEPA